MFTNVPRAGFAVELGTLGLRLDQNHQRLGKDAVVCHRVCSGCVSIAAMTASMSATSITNPTRVGFSGSTNVRMW